MKDFAKNAEHNALNAITLKDKEKSLALSIDGYQFPDMTPGKDDSYDLNWLNIRLSVIEGINCEEFVDACVLTWELDRIREAIDKLLKNEIDELDSDSMFLLTESTIYFSIRREGDGTWYKVDFNAKGFKVVAFIRQDKLIHIRKQLALGQRLFPQR